MTTFGKILVFVNLVFSLVVGALVVMVYSTSTPWATAFKAQKAQTDVAVADAQTYLAEKQRVITEHAALLADRDSKLKKLQDDFDAQVAITRGLQNQLQELKKQTDRSDSVVSSSLAEVKLRQADVAKIKEVLKKEQEENNRLVAANKNLTDQAVAAQIQVKSLRDRNDLLEGKMQEMARDLVRMKANVGNVSTVSLRAKNPPSEPVEGLVKNYDPSSNLMTITLGSDHGLSKGHTMEVYRLGRVPSQSKYLGTVRILDVTHNQAVAQPMGRMRTPPQVGDHVASRILGS